MLPSTENYGYVWGGVGEDDGLSLGFQMRAAEVA